MKQVAFDTTTRPVPRQAGSVVTVVDQGRRMTAPPTLLASQALILEDDPGLPVAVTAAPQVSGVTVAQRRNVAVPAAVDAGLTLPIGVRTRVGTSNTGSDVSHKTGGTTTRARRFSFDTETPDASCLYTMSTHAQHFHLPVMGAAPGTAVAGSTAPARLLNPSAGPAAPHGFYGYPAVPPGAGPYPHWSMPVSFPMQMPPAPYYPGMQFTGAAMFPPTGYPACAVDPCCTVTTANAAGAAVGAEKARLELGTLLPGQSCIRTEAQVAQPSIMMHPTHPGNAEEVTTVMLRNIPVKYTREMVLSDMDDRGFHGAYDFFYLPIDFQTGNTVGYAFINLVNEAETARFRAVYNGLQLSPDSAKICEVSDAKAQGKAKNVEQYRNSSVMAMEDKYHPVVFENGRPTRFPAPTRSLKPVKPRMKGQS